MSVEVRVLGPVQLLVNGAPVAIGGPKPRALLAALTLNRRRAVSSATLAEMVWNSDPPDAYPASLQVFVSNLRKALRTAGVDPAPVLRTEPSGYRLDIAEAQCDVDRFTAARAAGTQAATAGDYVRAGQHFSAALREWDGRAMADLAGWQFADDFATAMDEERLLATSARIDADLACGQAATVVAELVTLTSAHPLREPLWGQLITALYLSGRQADALEACRRVRSVLAEELGIDPGPALVALEQRVLRQESLDTGEIKRPEQLAAAMTDTVTEVPSAIRQGQLLLPDGRSVPVDQHGARLGRMTDNDVVIEDPKASRYHARIVATRAGLVIKDLHSANGVYVNEQPVDIGALLAEGDTIRVGNTQLRFTAAET